MGKTNILDLAQINFFFETWEEVSYFPINPAQISLLYSRLKKYSSQNLVFISKNKCLKEEANVNIKIKTHLTKCV